MSLEKLLALLSSRSLHLTQIDQFQDPWEGIWPDALRSALTVGQSLEIAKSIIAMAENITRSHFVSCWHQSEHESAALWSQYSGTSGFAIKSTVGDLKAALVDAPVFHIGAVEYIDYAEHPTPGKSVLDGMSHRLNPLFLKRKSFEYEREVRVVTSRGYTDNEQATSLAFPVRIESLVQALYIAPASPEWVVPTIIDVLSSFSLSTIPVARSSLYDPKID